MANVTIYSTQTCPYCKQEKAWLDEQGIKYTNYFVDEEPDKAQEMIDKSGQLGVPVTIVQADDKEEVVVGFDRARLTTLLKKAQ